MTAGLPGVGLSGVFFIVSALLMLPLEIARAMRGRSSLTRWLRVLRHLAVAVAMILCLELAYAAVRLALDRVHALPTHARGGESRVAHAGLQMLPVAPILATRGVIAVLLIVAKAAQLFTRWRKSGPLAIICPCSATSSRRSSRLPQRASPSPGPSHEA